MTDNDDSALTRVQVVEPSTLAHHHQKNGQDLGLLAKPDDAVPPVELVPASRFSFEELTAAYNRTRVDYIVPMPMNATRLREYVHNYDVDMQASAVALAADQVLGIVMLGMRPGHTWITRLGVLPVKRRRGAGQLLMKHAIDQSRRSKVDYIILEVIAGNAPAHRLFCKLGFYEIRDLLVLRRPPGPLTTDVNPYTLQVLDYRQVLELLQKRRSTPSWLDETRSLENAGNLTALRVDLKTGDWGWLVYQNRVFQLSRLVLQTEVGDPHQVGLALIHALHSRHPAQDTNTENLPADDPHWPAMQELGYIESFRRVEMRLNLS